MKKVFLYLRVSTQTQVRNGEGIDAQRKHCLEFAKNNNLEIVDAFQDNGISGTEIDRDGLQSILSRLDEVDAVLVDNTSRLWRDDFTKVLIQRELKKHQKDVIDANKPSYSIYNTDPNDFIINGFFELLDQYERLSINLKLKRARKIKAYKGHKPSGMTPLGYTWNGKYVQVDPKESETVKTIFNNYLSLGSLGKLQKYLDQENMRTKNKKSFSTQALKVILNNEFYVGKIHHGAELIEGKHEAIISKVIFGKVQNALKRKQRRRQ